MKDKQGICGYARRFVRSLKDGPARFLTPGVATAATVALVVGCYSPLIYQAPEASASPAAKQGGLLKAAKEKEQSAKAPSSGYSAPETLKDGTYTGYAECTESGVFDYYLALDVTVKGGKVTNISNVRGSATGNEGDPEKSPYSASDNDSYLKKAAAGVVSQLLSDAKSGTISESVDAVSGATYSSYAILSAYRDALSKAGASSAGDTDTAPASSGAGSSKTAHAAAHGISSKTRFADGTYTGYAECAEEDTFDYYLALDVTVKGGKVTNISNVRGSATGNKGDKRKAPYSASDNDSYLKKAAAGVTPQLLSDAKSGIVSKNIDTVSGATYSSQSILSAYYDALEKAAAAAGSKEKAAAAGKKPAVSGIGGSSGASSASPATIAIDSAPATYADGTYTAYAFCEDTGNASAFGAYYLGVTISVKGGNVAVEKIFGDEEGVVDPSYVYDAGENLRYLNRAINGYGISGKHPGLLKQITDQIAAGTVAGSYDTISGATYSSKSIIEAYAKALDAAKQSAAESSDGAGGDLQDRDAPDSDGSDASDSVGRA